MRRPVASAIGGGVLAMLIVGGLAISSALGASDESSPRDSAVSTATADGGVPTPKDSASLPDCIGVSSHDGVVRGCIKKSDLDASPPEYDAMMKTKGGLPVFASSTSSEVVGVMAGDVGYVPNELVGQIPALQACTKALGVAAQSPGGSALDANCHSLLRGIGYAESVLDGTFSSKDAAASP
jgi:hypothetical protein